MDANTAFQALRRWDDQRVDIPAEPWIKLALGIGLLRSGGRGSLLGRTLSLVAGSALVYRAISGRQGLAALFSRDVPPVPGRRATLVEGHLVASAAEPEPLEGVRRPEDVPAQLRSAG
ncbi:hypothetical protein [Ideonella sp. BN130291]|uniref:hypothetical protein n=1 Tax=Ideonella sp. BN130291 TaxID=3112940 RepID=UPI002E258D4E|nr:hypothetical protein [Ideonella sp. BN130291]